MSAGLGWGLRLWRFSGTSAAVRRSVGRRHQPGGNGVRRLGQRSSGAGDGDGRRLGWAMAGCRRRPVRWEKGSSDQLWGRASLRVEVDDSGVASFLFPAAARLAGSRLGSWVWVSVLQGFALGFPAALLRCAALAGGLDCWFVGLLAVGCWLPAASWGRWGHWGHWGRWGH